MLALSARGVAEAATYVVDTTSDGNLSGCTAGAADCSLRGAINRANSAPDPDTITFSVGAGPQTIALLSALPALLHPTAIDATTQPGFTGTPLLELNGESGGAGADALVIMGGAATIRGLVINRFGGDGVVVQGGSGSLIERNFIGTDLPGTGDRGNGGSGISIVGSSGNSLLDNVIAFNGQAGVSVFSGVGNFIYGSLFANDGPGIDLSPVGLTPNDPGDADAGANNLQNFPILTSVSSGPGSATIDGTLGSMPDTEYALDFYFGAACDPSGSGEGRFPIGTTFTTTDGGGDAPFQATFPITLSDASFVTATVTDPSDNTSEFSACLPVVDDADDDNDGVADVAEPGCGANAMDSTSRPERIDGAFAGADDDGDGQIDESLPAGSGTLDCDGDGYVGTTEVHVTTGDRDPCGGTGWSADLVPGGFQPNTLNIQDLASYIGPVRRINSSPGDSGYNVRWDLVPGSTFGEDINLQDLAAMLSGPTGYPPMFGGSRAMNHLCAYPP